MADRGPRPSTDQESAPLLRDPDAEDVQNDAPEPSLSSKINAIVQEPLTPLSKVLLVVALVLLLLTSVFVGLFAGVKHKLNEERNRDRDNPKPPAETVITTTTAVSITTTTSLAPVPTSPPHIPEEPPCLSPECIILSASILSSLDVTKDPCEKFYEFANGGWLASHPLPADKGSFGQFESLANENKQVIQRILESTDTTSSFTTSYDEILLKKLRDFYSSCTNEDQLNEIGTKPLLDIVKVVRRLYSGNDTKIVTEGVASEEDREVKKNALTATVAFLHSRGIDALFSFEIEGDVGVDPNLLVLWFSQPELGLPSKEYYEEEAVKDLYTDVLLRLLLVTQYDEEEPSLAYHYTSKEDASVFLTQDEDNAWPPWPWPPWGDDDDDGDGGEEPETDYDKAERLAKGVVEFESKIAAASLDLDIIQQNPRATYNPMPISNLTGSLPQIHFGEYFSSFTPRSFPERVILTHPPYADSLSKILTNTSEDVIEAYLITRAALAISPYLGMDTKAWHIQRSLVEGLTGIKKGAVGDRAEYCVGMVERTLGFAAGRYFVNVTFGGESREKGMKLITDIINSFEASLGHINWMDEKSATAAREKAEAIRVKVGFPISPDTRDPAAIARYYSAVEVEKDDFVGNVLRAAASDEFKTWLQLGKRRDEEAWEMNPSTVNAYFNPPANEIVFPAGILQPPFFSKDWPSYLSYGSFGHVAAHELTHAFDSAGRLYNQEGKLEEWWTKNTSKGFDAKQDCIVNQYSKYTIDDGKGGKIHVNGNLTSGENIGDTGLVQAYRAWKAQYAESFKAGNEYLLPGLNYTREQLFFISFARIWARSMKPAAAVQRIRTDPHSPSNYRVDGTVYNVPEFAEAFKCSKKSKLNPPPEEQCIFW